MNTPEYIIPESRAVRRESTMFQSKRESRNSKSNQIKSTAQRYNSLKEKTAAKILALIAEFEIEAGKLESEQSEAFEAINSTICTEEITDTQYDALEAMEIPLVETAREELVNRLGLL